MGIYPYFKSYDIRGIYPEPLEETMAGKIGMALGDYFKQLPQNANKTDLKIVVGRDMRLSAPSMAAALMDGLSQVGVHVLDIGMVTTPCQYYAIQKLQADGGVQVTASHNPPQYIGFKISRELAIPMSYDSDLHLVEQRVAAGPQPSGTPGSITTVNVDADYIQYVLGHGTEIRPLKVAIDGSNGMAGKYIPSLFEKLPCELVGLFLDPDGNFPNHEADPLKPENLRPVQDLVRQTNADVGFCFDGDGDRVSVVDETGAAIGCDMITAIIGQYLLQSQPGRAVTYDLRSSGSVRDAITNAGGQPVRVRVGHSHVKRQMRQIDAIFGGELSGHYYFRLTDGDTVYFADSALIAMMKILSILSVGTEPMSQRIAPLQKYFHSGEINYQVGDKDAALATIRDTFHDGALDTLDGISVDYPDWWFNVRPSNTEPLLRLTLEGQTPELRDQNLARVEDVLNRFGHRATSSH